MIKFLRQFGLGLFISILGMFIICAGGLVRMADFQGAKFVVPALAGLIYWCGAFIFLLPSRWVFKKTMETNGMGLILIIIALIITTVLISTLTFYLMPDGWVQMHNDSSNLMFGMGVFTSVAWIAASWDELKAMFSN